MNNRTAKRQLWLVANHLVDRCGTYRRLAGRPGEVRPPLRVLVDIVLGILGGILGGWLFGQMGIGASGTIGSILIAFGGGCRPGGITRLLTPA